MKKLLTLTLALSMVSGSILAQGDDAEPEVRSEETSYLSYLSPAAAVDATWNGAKAHKYKVGAGVAALASAVTYYKYFRDCQCNCPAGTDCSTQACAEGCGCSQN